MNDNLAELKQGEVAVRESDGKMSIFDTTEMGEQTEFQKKLLQIDAQMDMLYEEELLKVKETPGDIISLNDIPKNGSDFFAGRMMELGVQFFAFSSDLQDFFGEDNASFEPATTPVWLQREILRRIIGTPDAKVNTQALENALKRQYSYVSLDEYRYAKRAVKHYVVNGTKNKIGQQTTGVNFTLRTAK